MGVQLSHALFDVDFLHKPKIIAMRFKFGDLSALWLFEVICQLSRATDAVIDSEVALSIGMQFGYTNNLELLEYCRDKGILEYKNNQITNSRVSADQEKLQIRRESTKKRVTQHRSNASVTRYSDPDTVTDPEVLDLKKEVAPGKIQPGDLKILEFDQIQWEALSIQNDKTTLERAILLAESYIDKHKKKDPQRYRELCDEAKSGKSYLLSWPISEAMKQIKNEGAAQARLDKAKTPYQKPEEAPRAQPKLFVPKKTEEVTPEQKAKNLQMLKALTKTTAEKVSA